jgi:SNF family Na+-dependent transporter
MASLVRDNKNAAFVTSLVLGFLIVFTLSHIISVLKLYNHIPEYVFIACYLISITLNIIYLFRKAKYQQLINEFQTIKIHAFYHIVAYVFLAWCFIGMFPG